jgi:hypothetical protein
MKHTPPPYAMHQKPNRTLNRRTFAQSLLALSPAATTASWAQSDVARKTVRATPAELAAFGNTAPPWQLQGSGALRFFGFKAYDAHLWVAGGTPNPLVNKALFALEIDYNTSVAGEEIVNVSLVEMARLRRLSEAQVKTWNAEMQKTFPSVKSGDKLVGVYVPKAGTRFFFNGRLVSEINDPAFGDAFFAIWLDEGTKRPELRRALLGLTAVSAPQNTNQ